MDLTGTSRHPISRQLVKELSMVITLSVYASSMVVCYHIDTTYNKYIWQIVRLNTQAAPAYRSVRSWISWADISAQSWFNSASWNNSFTTPVRTKPFRILYKLRSNCRYTTCSCYRRYIATLVKTRCGTKLSLSHAYGSFHLLCRMVQIEHCFLRHGPSFHREKRVSWTPKSSGQAILFLKKSIDLLVTFTKRCIDSYVIHSISLGAVWLQTSCQCSYDRHENHSAISYRQLALHRSQGDCELPVTKVEISCIRRWLSPSVCTGEQ